MITELFSMLSSIDVTTKKGGKAFNINLNRNHIRSISAYSSNSIFYFTTVMSDQATPEEWGMVSRTLEKTYASFVVTCISLMPFHRISADDQGSIEEYLSQFHQNLGIKSGSNAVMSKLFGIVNTLEESAKLNVNESALSWENDEGDKVPKTCPKCGSKVGVFLKGEPVYLCTNKDCNAYYGVVECNESAVEDAAVKATQDFLLECWEKSRKADTDFIKVVCETVSLNDMYNIDPIDPVTKVMQEHYFNTLDELNTWGFIGEATAEMFDDPSDGLEGMSDEDILRSVMDDPEDYDDDEYDLESEYDDLDSLIEGAAGDFVRELGTGVVNMLHGGTRIGDYVDLEKRLLDLVNKTTTVEALDRLSKDASYGKTTLKKLANNLARYQKGDTKNLDCKFMEDIVKKGNSPQKIYAHIDWLENEYRCAIRARKAALTSSKNESAGILDEGNVKSAIDSIMFSLESVSENKILSCGSLTKLAKLEAKLNKLKTKYAKYLTRYKRKYNENKKNGTKSKLSITFNGAQITSPKAFMKQYGAYIKIINKRLKLVEKRRAELRNRKGLPADSKIEEAAGIGTLSEMDMQVLDHCISVIDESLNAPDEKIFTLIEAPTNDGWAHHRYLAYDSAVQSGNTKKADRIRDELIRAGYADPDPSRATTSGAGSTSGTPTPPPQPQSTDLYKQGYQAGAKSAGATNQRKYAVMTAERNALQKEVDDLKKNVATLKRNAKTPEDKKLMSDLEKQIADANKALQAQRDLDRSKYEALKLEFEQYKQQADNFGKTGKTGNPDDSEISWDSTRPKNNVNYARAAIKNGYEGHKTFSDKVFTDMEMKKANEAIPTFAKASIGFIVDETEQVVTRDILVGIKVQLHKIAASELIDDIYNCLINKRQFLKFVKFISGEEKSLADLLFGFRELKTDALNSTGARQWNSAFRRRKRWSKASVPYLMKNFTPNGTVVITMGEVQYIKDEYGIDIMTPEHVNMIMDSSFLLGFVVLDQANEICYITYDGHGGHFQEYTYAMLEREAASSDRMIRELYRSFSR